MGHPATEAPTIADLVVATSGAAGFDHEPGDFDTLREALSATGLVDAVADPKADLTVIAPTDRAFAELATTLGFDGDTGDEMAVLAFLADVSGFVSAEEPGLLDDVLLYHVATPARSLAELQAEGTIATLAEASFEVEGTELVDNDPDVENPELIPELTDIPTGNGVVHAADRVLLPVDLEEAVAQPNSVELLVAASGAEGFDDDAHDFDILREAVGAAGLAEALSDPGTELTVFAPTDGAFGDLAGVLGFEGDTCDEAAVFDFVAGATGFRAAQQPGLLDDILLYHVAAGEKRLAELQEAGRVETLEGGEIGVHGLELADNDPDVANPRIIEDASDLEAANGIAHAIDGVLLPVDVQGVSDDGLLIV